MSGSLPTVIIPSYEINNGATTITTRKKTFTRATGKNIVYLTEPQVYLSNLTYASNKSTCYSVLDVGTGNVVREKGERARWGDWVDYFVSGVGEGAG